MGYFQFFYVLYIFSFALVAGPSNYNGMAVFDCVPAQGTIGPGNRALLESLPFLLCSTIIFSIGMNIIPIKIKCIGRNETSVGESPR